jgi:ligand-binding sensor domain-containing protein/tRNA A-37 threonylcarbamoyl transferase component Bud32
LYTLLGCLCGLDPQKRTTQYSTNSWQIERGLPNSSVLSIIQDLSGYLWLGTVEGLVRFDGVNFTRFEIGNAAEIQGNFVNNLYIDHSGILWIGTLRGKLLSLEQGRIKNHILNKNVSGMSNNCICEDNQGDLWVGTSDGLFNRPSSNKEFFQKCFAFPSVRIRCLAKDLSGRILVGTMNQGVYISEKETWRRVLPDVEKIDGNIYVLRQASDGYLWLGTETGLYGFQDKQLLKHSLTSGLSTTITALVEDSDKNLWIGSENGLFRRRSIDFQFLDKEQALGSNIINSLFEDAEGSLWVGGVESGLTQIRDEKVTALTEREDLIGSKFRCLHGGKDGALWAGGSGGYLNRYENDRVKNYRLPTRFENIEIYSLEQDGDDSFWLGTDSGLVLFHKGGFREMPLPGPNPRIGTRCVLKDRFGRLWIGTWGAGLLCRQGEKFTAYSTADVLPDNRIQSLFEDRQGNLWVGCESGLAVMKPGMLGNFFTESSLINCQVFSFFQDVQGVLWVGTRQGLKVKKGGSWGSVNSDRGLFDSRIYAILEDDLGYLWLSSERGIFRARKDELEKAAFDKSLKVVGRLFDENDGMKSSWCNSGNPSGWKDRNGRLWFANLAGVVSVDPAHIRKNERMPPVLVEEVLVDQKDFLAPGHERLQEASMPAGSQRFEFHYTALSFIRSDKIEFKYKLEGYDRDWISAGNRRQAFYTNLRPGRYRFRVLAANADGVWNLNGASFSFYLRPFIFQTWWFMALAVLAFAMASAVSWQLLRKYLRAVSFFKKKTEVGHFKILETLGSGGMATVYKAQDLLNRKRLVALKVLKEENFLDETQRKRFKHESLIIEQLDHEHIVRVFERGEMDDCFYIAMELLVGESLAQLIRRAGRLPVGDALAIMRQIVDALRAIHAQNIVHRDLKPENIMICRREKNRHFVKLLDFGLAITPAQSRLTMSGVVMGTIRYLPPERLNGGISAPAGDIYSAGVILYEMVTGSRPFWSEDTGEVLNRILKTYPLPPREICPDIPQELSSLIIGMLDKEPGRRPGLEDLWRELQRLAETYPPAP